MRATTSPIIPTSRPSGARSRTCAPRWKRRPRRLPRRQRSPLRPLPAAPTRSASRRFALNSAANDLAIDPEQAAGQRADRAADSPLRRTRPVHSPGRRGVQTVDPRHSKLPGQLRQPLQQTHPGQYGLRSRTPPAGRDIQGYGSPQSPRRPLLAQEKRLRRRRPRRGPRHSACFISAFLEYKDTALRSERDVWAFTQLPTLAVIAWSGDVAYTNKRTGLKRLFGRKQPKDQLADVAG